jgi:hypothetical protein
MHPVCTYTNSGTCCKLLEETFSEISGSRLSDSGRPASVILLLLNVRRVRSCRAPMFSGRRCSWFDTISSSEMRVRLHSESGRWVSRFRMVFNLLKLVRYASVSGISVSKLLQSPCEGARN